MNFLDNLKREFGIANMLNKLIYINVFSFLVLNISSVIFSLLLIDISSIKELLMLPSSTEEVIKKPWSLISYMFIHDNFIHLLFNLIWLHFGGKLFLQYLNQKQLLYTYILGGLFGGILFIIAFNNLPALIPYSENAKALGASASVLAIFFAIATYIPNFQVSIPFIGFIKLKHIALIYIILDFLNIPNGNAGGHIAHLGGAIFGFFYVKQFTQKSAKNKQNQFLSYLKNIFNNLRIKKVTR
jgi:membrane associated rhomboid family serine protease